VLQKTSN